MKKITNIICSIALMLCVSLSAQAQTSAKAQKRIAYTVKNLKLNATQTKAVTPILSNYLLDIKVAKKPYSDLKDKYKRDIDKGLLTDDAAKNLLNAKLTFDGKENEIKKAYVKKLAAVIPYKKVYYCLDLINDKMSKIEGKKNKDNDDDDD